MAIADKITSIEEHLQADYNSIENLGIDLTNVNKNIENIAGLVDNIYDKFPKTEYAEGSNITLENTLKGKLDFEDGIVGYGDTQQTQYSGINLFNVNDKRSGSQWGATNVDDNDFIEINYDNTSGSSTTWVNIMTNVSNLLEVSSTYTCIVELKDIVCSSATINAISSYISTSSTGQFNSDFVINSNFTREKVAMAVTTRDSFSASATMLRSFIQISAGGKFSGKMRIMIVKGDVTSNIPSYQPFVGGTASPNPSYPQEIEVVKGKNRYEYVLKANNVDITKVNCNISIENDAYKLVSTGADMYFGEINASGNTWTGSKGAKIYTQGHSSIGIYISNTDFNRNMVTAYNKNNVSLGFTAINSGGIIYNPPAETEYITLRFGRYNSTSGTTYTTKIMVTLGDAIDTSYEPYNTLEVKVENKNRLSFLNDRSTTWYGLNITTENSTITINGTSTNTSSIYANGYSLKPTKLVGTYKLSGYTRNDSYLQLYWKDKNGTIKYKDMKNNPTIVFNEGDYLYQVFIFASSGTIMTFNNETFNLQLEEATTSTSFIPHQEQTQIVSLGDIELCKIGNYKDYFYRTSGKNLLDISKFQEHYTIDSNGLPAYNGGQTRITNTTPINVEGIEKVTLTCTLNGKSFIYSLLNADNTLVSRVAGNPSGTTITIGQAKYLYICFYDNATLSNITDAMLVKGSTALPYEPYGSGKWYKKEQIGKVVLNGSESNWNRDTMQSGLSYYSFYTSSYSTLLLPNGVVVCDKLMNNTTIYSTDTQGIYCNYGGAIRLKVLNNTLVDVAALKTWLGTNNLLVYCPLATPNDIEITNETLIEQLDNIENLMSYNGQTNIEVVGDLPMIIKARALKGE